MYPSWNARAVGLVLDARETVEIAAQAGFAGVDLLVRDLVRSAALPHELRARMDDLGLRGGAWPLPVDWRGPEARFAEDLRNLPRYARAAAVLGLFRTGTWVLPEASPELAESAQEADAIERTARFHLDRLGRIAAILADHGSRLGLEILGPASARAGRTAPFVRRYGDLEQRLGRLRKAHANVGVLADAFHLFAAGENNEASLVWGADAVVWVHLADAAHGDRASLRDHERTLPGATGWGDCRGLLALLHEQGYAGPVTAEPLAHRESLQGMSALDAARQTRAALRSIWPIQPEV
ncbi:MAG: sugar phosphate isomerase/epimerase family protein [Isosphaeraceae bacterium]